MLGARMIVPFDSAIRELHAHAKAIRFRQTIDHSSYLRRLPRGRNKRFFPRPPGPLAGYTRTVGTDIFRERSFPSAGFLQACEVDGNGNRKALLNPAVHCWLPRGEEGVPT